MTTRNTPAYAGKTSGVVYVRKKDGKHPRVCGEDHDTAGRFSKNLETPPRMRGRPFRELVKRRLAGNTPAYAGKTVSVINQILRYWKHPRVCGEDSKMNDKEKAKWETPPRMRGRPLHSSLKVTLTGNTPAYAGKT